MHALCHTSAADKFSAADALAVPYFTCCDPRFFTLNREAIARRRQWNGAICHTGARRIAQSRSSAQSLAKPASPL
jgi:hypothetical protein